MKPQEPFQNFKTEVPLSGGRGGVERGGEGGSGLSGPGTGTTEGTVSKRASHRVGQPRTGARHTTPAAKDDCGAERVEEILLKPLFTKSPGICILCLLVSELFQGLFVASPVSSHIPALSGTNCAPDVCCLPSTLSSHVQ